MSPIQSRSLLCVLLLLPLLGSIQCAHTATQSHGDKVELYGILLDRDGKGIEGISIFIDDRAWNATNAHGAYRTWVRPGRHRVMLGGFRVRVPQVDLDTITIGPTATRLDHRFGGFKVSGSLIGPRGKSIREGRVEGYGHSPDVEYGIDVGSTLKDGRYTFFVPRGTYWFKTFPRPESYPSIDEGAGDPRISITSDTTINFSADGHLISGRILLRGRPFASGRVEAYGVSWPDTLRTQAWTTTTTDGAYRLYVPSGSYALRVRRGEDPTPFATRWMNREITAPTRIDWELAVTYWTGSVRDSATGAPVESAYVWAGDPREQYSRLAVSMSDSKGRFRLELEPKQSYSLSWSRGNVFRRQFAAAVAGDDSMFDVRVSRSSR